ncbi:hypothetical protein BDF20DRAFT_400816 [Mycotypha africana]|uniref:uncharacterized protein n=1 Tax=Mycotypha africana TaxID=64632 RepID=UPI002300A9CD|nr:uncharacterized protein BDF20DRAFT_400816 [Mycotypha africana]KAI8984644.1 hypothetical protein BDF20DRAFT_400816 [Mycotypha africana]
MNLSFQNCLSGSNKIFGIRKIRINFLSLFSNRTFFLLTIAERKRAMEVKQETVKEEDVTAEEALANSQSVITMYEKKLLTQFARVTNLMKISPNSTEAMEALKEYSNLESNLNTLRTMKASFEKNMTRSPSTSASPASSVPSFTYSNNDINHPNAQVQTKTISHSISVPSAATQTDSCVHTMNPGSANLLVIEKQPGEESITSGLDLLPTLLSIDSATNTLDTINDSFTLSDIKKTSNTTEQNKGPKKKADTENNNNNNNNARSLTASSTSSQLSAPIKRETEGPSIELAHNGTLKETESNQPVIPTHLQSEPSLNTEATVSADVLSPEINALPSTAFNNNDTTATTIIATPEHGEYATSDRLDCNQIDPRLATHWSELGTDTEQHVTNPDRNAEENVSYNDTVSASITAETSSTKRQLAKRSLPLPRSSSSSASPSPTFASTSEVKATNNKSAIPVWNSAPSSLDMPATSASTPIISSITDTAPTGEQQQVKIETYLKIGKHPEIVRLAIDFFGAFGAALKASGIPTTAKPPVFSDRQQDSQQVSNNASVNWEDLFIRILERTENLESEQRAWFLNYLINQGISWNEALERIAHRYFSLPEMFPITKQELYSSKQCENESNLSFVKRWLGLFRRANIPDEREVAMAFCLCLQKHVLQKIRHTLNRNGFCSSVYEVMHQVILNSPEALQTINFRLAAFKVLNFINSSSSSNSDNSSRKSKLLEQREKRANEQDRQLSYQNQRLHHSDPRCNKNRNSSSNSSGSNNWKPSNRAEGNENSDKRHQKKRRWIGSDCTYCHQAWTPGHTCLEFIEAKRMKAFRPRS